MCAFVVMNKVPILARKGSWTPLVLEFKGHCEQPNMGAGGQTHCGRGVCVCVFSPALSASAPALLFSLYL